MNQDVIGTRYAARFVPVLDRAVRTTTRGIDIM